MTTANTQDTPGLLMPPPFFLLIAILAAVILDWISGFNFLAPISLASPQLWLGLVIVVAGAALAVRGRNEFVRAGTNVNPFQPALKIVTTGPYRFSRNPMYLGMVVFMLGVSLMFSLEWGVILTPVLWLAFDRLVVVREEAYLAAKFGDSSRTLLTRTRRWI